MQKDATISLRIDSDLKNDVDKILKSLGIPMTTAITMYFKQIKMKNGIPFTPIIPNMPKAYEDYTEDEIALMCDKAIEEHNKGNTISSEDVELKLRKKKMINNQMNELIKTRKNIDANDNIATQNIWDKEIEVMTFSIDATVEFLNTSDKDTLYWSSEVWEDVSSVLKSLELVDAMEKSASRFDDIRDELLECANDARKALND